MTRTYSDDGIHSASLASLVEDAPHGMSAAAALEFGLRAIADRVTVTNITFGEPRWTDQGWARRATVKLAQTAAPGETARFTVEIPWLTDTVAAAQATFGVRVGAHRGTWWGRARLPVAAYVHAPGVHYVHRPELENPALRALLAPQWGTSWWVELTRARVRAQSGRVIALIEDLVRLTSDSETGDVHECLDRHGLTLILAPDPVGDPSQNTGEPANEAADATERTAALRLAAVSRHHASGIKTHTIGELQAAAGVARVVTTQLVDAVGLRARGLALDDDDRTFDRALLMAGDDEESERLARLTASPILHAGGGAWDIPEMRAVIDTLVRLDEAGGRLPPATVLMDRENWHLAGYGELLASAIADVTAKMVRGILRTPATAAAGPDRDVDLVAARLRSAVQRAVIDVAVGRRDHADAQIVERPINTLGHVEASRQRTFLGPHGLESFEGRLDLRVQPTEWHGELCPVQTPESRMVGFVRHRALGDGDDDAALTAFGNLWGGDLSVAAALVPYVNHDEPTRIALGAKMFRQAVVLACPEPPLVRTGAERIVGEAGVVRARRNGKVSTTDAVRGILRVGGEPHAFGPAASDRARQDDDWQLEVSDGALAARGDILAVAPDVAIEDGEPVFAFGVNAQVAFLGWRGWNYEDGIVVSASFAARMTSHHTIRLSADVDIEAGELAVELIYAERLAEVLPAGEPVVRIDAGDPHGRPRILTFSEPFRLLPAESSDGDAYLRRERRDDGGWSASVRVQVTRPLRVGDKLTTRHGGKGVVTHILDDDEMPRLEGGSPLDVLLNPLGVLRRLNIGTFIELHQGLAATREAEAGDAPVAPVAAVRQLGDEGRRDLAARLDRLGAPGGRQVLTNADGERVGPEEGVLAGPLYLVRLDHLARDKAGAREDGPASPLTFQPLRGGGWRADHKLASPQRLGEMELWSLDAIGATRLVDDLFDDRGVGEAAQRNLPAGRRLLPAGFRAALAHLAVGGVHVEAVHGDRVHDLTEHSTVGEAGAALRVVRNDGHELRDVVAEFETTARGIHRSSADVAKTILTLVLADPRDRAAESPDARQSVRFAIPLPSPVPHPWRTSGFFGPVRLPDLTRLPLLPASLLSTTEAGEWGGLRQRYARIVEDVIEIGRLRAAAPEDSPADTSEIERALARRVRALLGRIGDTPADDTVAGRLSGKFGLLRRNMLGGAAVRSGRAVLAGAPDLDDPEVVRLPTWMADALGVPPQPAKGAGDVVIVNRQPTLHPYNLLALRVQRWQEDAVALHPILLSMIAGDFDGDTVAVHRPSDERAREEAWDLLRPAASLRSGARGELLAKIDLDVALGHVLTGEAADSDDVRRLAESVVHAEPGRPARALRDLAAFAREGYAAAGAWSPSVIDEIARASLQPGAASGAVKGADLPLLFDERGDVISPASPEPIGHVAESYLDGLSDADYFLAAQQSVAGLAAKKLVTPFAGALTRRLVRSAYEVVVTDDCTAPLPHTPLVCNGSGVCAAACGDDRSSGKPFPPGARVGIRSALFMGERGTQRALKSIHLRGGNGLRGTVAELGALVGAKGTIHWPAEHPKAGAATNFAEVLRWSWAHAESLDPAREVLRDRFVELLDGEVDPVHLEILLRPVWGALASQVESNPASTRAEIDDALGRIRSAMTNAAWDGDLRPIVRALAARAEESLDAAEDEPVLLATVRNSGEAAE